MARHDIHVVQLYVVFGADTDRARRSRSPTIPAFFEELRRAETLPTTSQPSVGDFTSVYEPLLAEGREIVSVHISGGLSGTPEAARQAKEALEREGKGGERIEVIDSTTAAGGLGFMVLAAAKAAGDGKSAAEVAEHVRSARADLKLWFVIDTLEFLKRGGRIGAASAWIGSTLKVKPILTVENEMTPVERVRTSSRAMERMVDYARQRKDSGADAWSAQHINAPDALPGADRALQRGVRPAADDRQRDRPGAVGSHRARACSAWAASPPTTCSRRAPERPPGGGANSALSAAPSRTVVRIVLIVVCVAICLYLLWLLRKPISWILIAAFLAVALSGPVNYLATQHAPRLRRHASSFSACSPCPVLLIALIVPPLITEANNFAQDVPDYARDVTKFVQDNDTLRSLNEDYNITEELEKQAGKLPDQLGGAAGTLRDVGLGIVNSLFALITILVLTVFLLANGRERGWIRRSHRGRPSSACGCGARSTTWRRRLRATWRVR